MTVVLRLTQRSFFVALACLTICLPVPAQESDVANAKFHYKVALKAIAENDFAVAASELEAAANLDPTNSLIQYNLAVVYSKTGQPKKALNALDRAEALGLPDDVKAGADELRVDVTYALRKSLSEPRIIVGGLMPGRATRSKFAQWFSDYYGEERVKFRGNLTAAAFDKVDVVELDAVATDALGDLYRSCPGLSDWRQGAQKFACTSSAVAELAPRIAQQLNSMNYHGLAFYLLRMQNIERYIDHEDAWRREWVFESAVLTGTLHVITQDGRHVSENLPDVTINDADGLKNAARQWTPFVKRVLTSAIR